MIIKFHKFLEAISGTELIGHMGPNYGEQRIPNTLNTSDTSVIFSEITNTVYTQDDYQSLYNNYLKSGGEPLFGFTKENLDKILFSMVKEGKENSQSTIDFILGHIPTKIEKSIDGSIVISINSDKNKSKIFELMNDYIISQDFRERVILFREIVESSIIYDLSDCLDAKLYNIDYSYDSKFNISLIFYTIDSPIWTISDKIKQQYN